MNERKRDEERTMQVHIPYVQYHNEAEKKLYKTQLHYCSIVGNFAFILFYYYYYILYNHIVSRTHIYIHTMIIPLSAYIRIWTFIHLHSNKLMLYLV